MNLAVGGQIVAKLAVNAISLGNMVGSYDQGRARGGDFFRGQALHPPRSPSNPERQEG
jgi:hypothetical protein